MKKAAFLACCLFLLSGCWQNVDYARLFDAGRNLVGAAAVSDQDAIGMSMRMRQHMDLMAKVAPNKSKYAKRLAKVMGDQRSVNGVPLNYKVYIDPELNANASPDGSIRVNSGLMDAMNDDELRFVLGHEIGHIAEGHVLKNMRMAYATAAAKSAAGAAHPYAALATESGLGDLAREFAHAQYSQSQELDADKYGMNYLKSKGIRTEAALSAMRKLGNSPGGFFASHPSSQERLQKLSALR